MTSIAVRREEDFRLPRWLRGPEEGWASVALLAIMLATVALAIDDARWAGITADGASETSFLAPLILMGALWGFVSAKSKLPTLVADAVGAALGTVAVLVGVAGVVSHAPGIGPRLSTLSDTVYLFYRDLVVLGVRSAQTSVFLLVLGAVVWCVGQVAANSVFRRRRPLSAVGIAGLGLLVELCVAAKNQYGFLIIFAAAALGLLVRFNLLEQRAAWTRRHIGDPTQVGSLYVRSGTTFIALTLIGSLVLTASASSAPLAGVLDQPALRDQLVNWGEQLNLIVGGVVGTARGPNGLFTSSSTISGVWEASGAVVFRARTSDNQGYYWRGATYDLFDGTTWKQTDRSGGQPISANVPLLADTREAIASASGRRAVTATIADVDIGTDTLLTPEDPLSVDRTARVYTSGPGGPFAMAELTASLRSGEAYTVAAMVLPSGRQPGAPTVSQLAAAGVLYPTWALRYVQTSPGLGPLARQTADQLVARLPAAQRDPFHIALAVQDYLYSSGGFTYQTDVRGLCPGNEVVECFLTIQRGYCEYFATTMVMLLRAEGIPARYVKGYLPGRQLADGSWEVDRGAAHAWVQVYFPKYGWIDFDPTPGNRENSQHPAVFESGGPLPSPSGPAGSRASPSFGGDQGPEASRQPGGASPGSTNNGGSGNTGPVAVVVVGAVALLLLALARRNRRRANSFRLEPDAVYRGMTRLATRLGYAPLPTQTAYEYAGALGEIVPAARDELQLVARAKVEATYARRPFRGERLAALHAAYRRLRLRLLRLLFRRHRGFR